MLGLAAPSPGAPDLPGPGVLGLPGRRWSPHATQQQLPGAGGAHAAAVAAAAAAAAAAPLFRPPSGAMAAQPQDGGGQRGLPTWDLPGLPALQGGGEAAPGPPQHRRWPPPVGPSSLAGDDRMARALARGDAGALLLHSEQARHGMASGSTAVPALLELEHPPSTLALRDLGHGQTLLFPRWRARECFWQSVCT